MPLNVAASRLAILSFLLGSLFLLASPSTPDRIAAASSPVRVSQIYSSGGSTGSTYKCDFIELFNPSNDPVSMTGWSVQAYADAWTVIRLGSKTIPARSYFLIAPSSGCGSSGQALPIADYQQSYFALYNTRGQVALVVNETTINGLADPDIVDFVGYGNTTLYEGAGPAPAPTTTTSVQRADGGCVDSNNNLSDFAALTPIARNTASPQRTCSDPLAVRLETFEAYTDGASTHATWETVDEVDALSFELFAGPSAEGPWRLLTAKPIPANAPGSTQGSRYVYTFKTAPQEPWCRLESNELGGVRQTFGPVPIAVGHPTSLRLVGLSVEPAVGVGVFAWPALLVLSAVLAAFSLSRLHLER